MLSALALAELAAQSETPLPDPDSSLPLEIEPPLLIPARGPDGSIPDLPGSSTSVTSAEMTKLESDLAKAQKRAASADRLYKAGIIAKVDAEQRVLKVVQMQAALAEARLQVAKASAEQEPETEAAVAVAEEAAQRAGAERHRAEMEQALRNLQRQQKLLALGSGRKADVNRAEQKLAELQRGKE